MEKRLESLGCELLEARNFVIVRDGVHRNSVPKRIVSLCEATIEGGVIVVVEECFQSWKMVL